MGDPTDHHDNESALDYYDAVSEHTSYDTINFEGGEAREG